MSKHPRSNRKNASGEKQLLQALLSQSAKEGWTQRLREKYLCGSMMCSVPKGGMSFKAYMENMRIQAIANILEQQRAYYEE